MLCPLERPDSVQHVCNDTIIAALAYYGQNHQKITHIYRLRRVSPWQQLKNSQESGPIIFTSRSPIFLWRLLRCNHFWGLQNSLFDDPRSFDVRRKIVRRKRARQHKKPQALPLDKGENDTHCRVIMISIVLEVMLICIIPRFDHFNFVSSTPVRSSTHTQNHFSRHILLMTVNS